MTIHPRIRALGAAASVPLAGLAIGACGGGGQATPAPPKTPSGRTATVGVENDGKLGKVLVDARGRTLYEFQKDTGDKSTCHAACAASWPPVTASGKPVAGPGITASKLGTTPRSNGSRQVVYNGHPLYRFSGDSKPGDTNGQGVSAFGAPWYAVSGAGTVVTRSVPKSGGGGNGGGGIY